jgi:hypothetical protein
MNAPVATAPEEPRGWKPAAWLKAIGNLYSRPKLYQEVHAGRIEVAKAGGVTVILTPPGEYLASLPKGLGPPISRRRKAKG